MKKVLRYITVLMLTVTAASSQSQIPECYSNYDPPAGHGIKTTIRNKGHAQS